MNKKKIGIDLDTTLNNMEEVWLQKYNKDYNDNIKFFRNWDIHKEVKKECGEKIYEYIHEPKFFYNLNIKPKAKETIDYLSKHYELYIVTAYTADVCQDKVSWILKHKLKIKEKNIIFINNKGILDLDYLIDDGPHNFDNFKGVGIVMDMMYNKHIKTDYNRVRAYNWADVKKFFEIELKNEKIS